MVVTSLLAWPPVAWLLPFVPSFRTIGVVTSNLPGSNEHSEHNVHSKHQLTVRRAGIEFRLKNESSVRPDLH